MPLKDIGKNFTATGVWRPIFARFAPAGFSVIPFCRHIG